MNLLLRYLMWIVYKNYNLRSYTFFNTVTFALFLPPLTRSSLYSLLLQYTVHIATNTHKPL